MIYSSDVYIKFKRGAKRFATECVQGKKAENLKKVLMEMKMAKACIFNSAPFRIYSFRFVQTFCLAIHAFFGRSDFFFVVFSHLKTIFIESILWRKKMRRVMKMSHYMWNEKINKWQTCGQIFFYFLSIFVLLAHIPHTDMYIKTQYFSSIFRNFFFFSFTNGMLSFF